MYIIIIKFGFKRLMGSKDGPDKHDLKFWAIADLERSNPIFSQDTLPYPYVPPNYVWLQKD